MRNYEERKNDGMIKYRNIYGIIYLLLMTQDALGEGVIVDHILAVVNEEVITLSAVQDYPNINCFIKKEKECPSEININLIYEYIERRLILQEDKKLKLSSIEEKEIEKELKKLTNQESEQRMNILGLDISTIKNYLLEELIIRTHTERRLGFLVRIDEKEIANQLQERRNKATPGSSPLEVREEVRKDLFRKKLEEQKKLWLKELIEKAEIRVIGTSPRNQTPAESPA